MLFNILKDHGHLFSHTFWNSIFCSVIFPVYNSVSGKREVNLHEAHCSTSSVSVHTEGSTWDSETYSVAAECLIDVFVTFFDVVRSQLPGVVSVLTGFIRSPVQGPASTGVAGLVRLTDDLGNKLSVEEWKEIFLCLKDAAMSTVPGFMKVLRTMNNIEVPRFPQPSTDLESSSDYDLTNDEFDDDNLQTATYVVSRTKNHIAMQLLIVQVYLLLLLYVYKLTIKTRALDLVVFNLYIHPWNLNCNPLIFFFSSFKKKKNWRLRSASLI